jgi:TolB protein
MLGMRRLDTAVATAVSTAGLAGALAVLAHATASGPNGQIAFKQALGSPSRLAIVTPDRTGMRQLPRTKQVSDDNPDWSPNGSTIAFDRCPLANGPCGVFTMRPDGTGVKRLGPPGDDRVHPAWAPNGKQVAYVRSWGGVQDDQIRFSELYVMNVGGTGTRRVTAVTLAKPFSADLGRPAWSPDGRQIVFEVANSPRGEPAKAHALFVVNADGSDLRELTPWSLNAGDSPDWSPDGKQILFKAPASGQHGNLYTIATDGTGLHRLTNYPAPTAVFLGSFSPDGRWITFAKSADVFVMRVDGTGARQVSRGVSAWSPDWGAAR